MRLRKTIAAIATLLICAGAVLMLLTLNRGGPRDNVWDWLETRVEERESRRWAASVLRTSESFEFEREGFRLTHGMTFRFCSDSGRHLIVYLPHPSNGDAFLEKEGHKVQRVFASQRYGGGIEIGLGSKMEKRLAELVRTAVRPENEKELNVALDAIEKRVFDWSQWGGEEDR